MTPGPHDPSRRAVAAILQAVDAPVIVCSRDGGIEHCNAAAVAVVAQWRAAAPREGGSLTDLFPDGLRSVVEESLKEAAAGRTVARELTVTDRLAAPRLLALRWAPLPESAGGQVCVTLRDITGRRHTEQRLDVLRRALDAITEGVVIADLDQRAIYYNRAFERLTGGGTGEPHTMGGMTGGAADVAGLRQAIRHRLETHEEFVGEMQGAGSDGRPSWSEIAVHPLRNDRGEVTHYVGVREDITARKQMEHSLEESRSRLQALITTAMDGIVSFDEEQRIVLINRAACAMFGLSEDAASGCPIEQLIPGLLGATHAEPIRRLEGTRDPSAVSGRLGELHGVRADGERFPIEVSISQVQVHARQIFTVILRDISARREAERVLQASQRRFKSIFEHSIDGILLVDDGTALIDVNPAACDLLGQPREALLKLDLRQLYVPPPEQRFEEVWQQFLDRGSANGEATLRRSEQRPILIEFSAIGNILRGLHLVIIRDLTERRALQEQLLRQQRLDSVGRLASGLAHDLNNILTPILMVPGMLRGRVQDAASLSLLDLLEQGARRGAAIVEQLLTFARERPGERKLQHLGAMAESAVRIIRETFPKNIDLDLRVEGQPWPFLGDATQVQQLILNLAMNAKDAMPQGGKLILAVANEQVSPEQARTLPGAKAAPYVVLSVVDSGQGIEPQHLERIFDPFFTTKPLGESTGLGLSAALGIANRHGGFITVHSRPRHGATFRVYLPAVGIEAPGSRPPTPLRPPTGSGETVLVVDDEEDLRQISRHLLGQHGYNVVCARDGESALAQLKAVEDRVDLVLTDLAMPGMGGERLITHLRRRNPQLRIIVMTGHDPARGVEAGRIPVHGYLRKPFSGEELLRAMADARAAGEPTAPATPSA